jgi:hypothetical protein
MPFPIRGIHNMGGFFAPVEAILRALCAPCHPPDSSIGSNLGRSLSGSNSSINYYQLFLDRVIFSHPRNPPIQWSIAASFSPWLESAASNADVASHCFFFNCWRNRFTLLTCSSTTRS